VEHQVAEAFDSNTKAARTLFAKATSDETPKAKKFLAKCNPTCAGASSSQKCGLRNKKCYGFVVKLQRKLGWKEGFLSKFGLRNAELEEDLCPCECGEREAMQNTPGSGKCDLYAPIRRRFNDRRTAVMGKLELSADAIQSTVQHAGLQPDGTYERLQGHRTIPR
jgi:hypothetical protein